MTATYPGFVRKRTRELTADWPVEDGAEPFRATIICSLSFAEIEAIPLISAVLDPTFQDLFNAIAPYVVAWNALAFNLETKQYEPAPAPAEAGPDVLRAVDPIIGYFLALQLKQVNFGDASRPKELKPSDATPDGQSETD